MTLHYWFIILKHLIPNNNNYSKNKRFLREKNPEKQNKIDSQVNPIYCAVEKYFSVEGTSIDLCI